MDIILNNIWLILFVVWGIPLTWFRSKFRKMVYQTDSWIINIKPVFMDEIKALFGNKFPDNRQYIRLRNSYRSYLSIYLILFLLYVNFQSKAQTLNSNKMATVSVGSIIPEFSLKDQSGNNFDIQSVLGKKNLVIYFYPKDDSPGCTKEACSFRDQFEVFADANALIIGISSQSVKSHKEFADKYRLNYTLLSDEEGKVRKLFGVPTNFLGLIPGRVTYVVNKEGKVVYLFNSQIKAEQHVSEALKILKEMK
ncbi:MAG: peroxiredoxin [Prolixibacteraceae bacterium]